MSAVLSMPSEALMTPFDPNYVRWVKDVIEPNSYSPDSGFAEHNVGSIYSSVDEAKFFRIEVNAPGSSSGGVVININEAKEYLRRFFEFSTLSPVDMAFSWSLDKGASEFSLLIEKISSWQNLAPDWDGEGGVPLSEAVAQHAIQFVNQMIDTNVPLPKIYIAGDDEVGFRWSDGERRASASFLDDGHFVAFCPSNGNDPKIEIDLPYNAAQLPTDVSKFLTLIAKTFK